MGKKRNADAESDTTFPKKWLKKLPENWTEVAEGYDSETLKKKVVEWEQAIATTEKDMDADNELLALKEELKDKAEVYKKSISESQAMIRYAVYLLENRGAA